MNHIFQPVKKNGQTAFYQAQIQNKYLIVYGTRHLKRSDLREYFPHFQFCFVKQIHGSHVVEASPKKLIPADGHWTQKKHTALSVQTADCLPVFLVKEERICAIHAGWRGVYHKIVPHALTLIPGLCRPELEISIGPHILQESFTIKEDVAQKLIQSSPSGDKWVRKTGQGQYQACLMSIVQDQILSKTPIKNSYLLPFNTFSSNLFYSFRKSAEKKKGQTSFIVQL